MGEKRCHISISRVALETLIGLPEEGKIKTVIYNYSTDTITMFLEGIGPEMPEGAASVQFALCDVLQNSLMKEIET